MRYGSNEYLLLVNTAIFSNYDLFMLINKSIFWLQHIIKSLNLLVILIFFYLKIFITPNKLFFKLEFSSLNSCNQIYYVSYGLILTVDVIMIIIFFFNLFKLKIC